ncbi:3-hydroxyisobutyrate dehydrogenase [Streptoalloteichus tenebrarius]|uniref:3-hydroxyisobutyrate dehydrogenase n=1 Tax=Streptoalloteichus tenebrarius (strain ATCC 17920 / DSM 40477 / JCM 4838 / CBS 697.72 / NBRC 16177 / NCIMB 11028 / NRRL B-12390 / A12253. 1 / ISP 5477) TaxID=1933 RepID=A0ABT1I3J8_STRSD|nr:NAD(P)-dependent oxidoreductase [Streptoalloteichus tenebrarius]MCP2262365.1 3-hydroxyisobutyrate dehydrogenase [Streptoalloteichus tenebrarius]BFF00634.1 NAD(P)-dependent oxidoreductase [Streptoalloteichus tenebrarius]
MTTRPVVAVLGLGIMGRAMARNLLRHGLPVRVWNRTAERAAELAGEGAVAAASPAEAVTGADVVLTMLTDGPAVAEVMREAAPGLRAGQVWFQATTVGVEAVTGLAELAGEHGLVFVDAPVQGTRQPAEAGQLVVLAAGPASARELLRPVFEAVGRHTEWLGEDGSSGVASRLKLVLNSWALTMTNGVAEAVALARGLGVDPALFGRVIAGGPMDSQYLQAKAAAILAGDFTPSFSVRNAEKDARLVAEAAERAGVRMDLALVAGERFRRARELGHGDEDMVANYFGSFPN